MIIGFDFDKVFIDYPPFVPYSIVDLLYKGSSFFKSTSTNGKMHYRYPGPFEQKLRILTHYSLFRPLINENFEILKKISSSKKNKTYLVSSRFGFLEERTNSLLKKYGLKKYFNGIYFNFKNEQPHKFKEQTIKKLKINTYIDDDIHLAIYLSSKIPKLNIFWVKGTRNSPENLPKNITPIENLSSLERYLKSK